jgi:6-phosphogluconolactonase
MLYRLLAEEPFRSAFPWERTHLFFGDERFVAPTHADSNYRMVKEALLDHVPLPEAQVHAFPTDGTPEAAARRYEEVLKAFYGADRLDPTKPLFDVTLLGLGEDGHTASLFPGVAALDEREAWAAAVIGAKPEPRLTLTYPALQSSGTVAFLVTGAAKEVMLARAMAGDEGIPAGRVRPEGEFLWFADLAAAGE